MAEGVLGSGEKAPGRKRRIVDGAVIGRGSAMFNRREFIVGTCLCVGGVNVDGEAADLFVKGPQVDGDAARLLSETPAVYGPDFEGPLPPDLYTRGTRPPTTQEEAVARRILRSAPTSSPLAIMRYFANLRDVNRDGEAYNAGWATRWNPVIV